MPFHGSTALDTPLGMPLGYAGLAAVAVLVPVIAPFTAVAFCYRGYRYRRSDDPSRRRIGTVLLVVGVLLAAYAAMFLVGLAAEPAFEEPGPLRTSAVAR